jgi:hypothetical protein
MIENLTRGTVLARRAETARTPWAQLVGLLGRHSLPPDEGLVLPGTRGVHTHFMRFAVDVIFYGRSNVVLGIAHNLRPWRFSRYYWRAVGAIELRAGAARASGTEPGDSLALGSK